MCSIIKLATIAFDFAETSSYWSAPKKLLISRLFIQLFPDHILQYVKYHKETAVNACTDRLGPFVRCSVSCLFANTVQSLYNSLPWDSMKVTVEER